MRQFDVCWASGQGVADNRVLVVILQHHDLEKTSGLIVAPMFAAAAVEVIERLRIPTKFKGKSYVVAVDRMGSLPKRQLGVSIGNLEAVRYEMTKAIDLIFSGF